MIWRVYTIACSTSNTKPKTDLTMCCEKLRTAFEAPEKCFDNLLHCEENKRKFSIELPKKSTETFCRARLDGCIIDKNAPIERCDFMFLRCSNEDIYFVELKGSNIPKALAQIKSTIGYTRPKLNFQPDQITGFIVCSRCPLTSVEVQKLKKEFKEKKYGKTLEVHSREWTHKVELKQP